MNNEHGFDHALEHHDRKDQEMQSDQRFQMKQSI
jgi:hypothetical protein